MNNTSFKYFLFLVVTFFALANVAFAYTSPGKPVGYVNDFAQVIPAGERTALENKIANFAQQAGVEIVVATVSGLNGDTIENFAVKLFAEWGIGKKNTDNGILILVSPTEKQTRIEVGYGLEPVVTDAMSSAVIRTVMIPAFKNGDYYGGINAGVDQIMKLADPGSGAELAPSIAGEQTPIYIPIIGVIILAILLSTKFGRRILFYMFLSNFFGGGRGGRGDRGGGFGGGFGGFGGGRSGGGGASGSW